jgi:hypothetical protein
MSGHLYELRRQWRFHTGDANKTLETPAAAFINLFGTTATFMHIGMDCEYAERGSRHYMGQLYAVFSVGVGHKSYPMTPLDLESLAATVNNLRPGHPNRLKIMENLQLQLERAVREMGVHRKTFAQINPYAAMLGQRPA